MVTKYLSRRKSKICGISRRILATVRHCSADIFVSVFFSGVVRILLQGARARGARVPKFVVTKSSRSESHLALGLQNLRAFANSRGHVPGDNTDLFQFVNFS